MVEIVLTSGASCAISLLFCFRSKTTCIRRGEEVTLIAIVDRIEFHTVIIQGEELNGNRSLSDGLMKLTILKQIACSQTVEVNLYQRHRVREFKHGQYSI